MKNKAVLFLFTFLFSICGTAAQNNFSIEVIEKNNLGIGQFDKIIWKDRKLTVNNAAVEKILYPLAISDIHMLKTFKPITIKNCRLGRFQVKNGSQILSGCLEDENFRTVKLAMQHLKYLVLLSLD